MKKQRNNAAKKPEAVAECNRQHAEVGNKRRDVRWQRGECSCCLLSAVRAVQVREKITAEQQNKNNLEDEAAQLREEWESCFDKMRSLDVSLELKDQVRGYARWILPPVHSNARSLCSSLPCRRSGTRCSTSCVTLRRHSCTRLSLTTTSTRRSSPSIRMSALLRTSSCVIPSSKKRERCAINYWASPFATWVLYCYGLHRPRAPFTPRPWQPSPSWQAHRYP